jgi:hypothetical protein
LPVNVTWWQHMLPTKRRPTCFDPIGIFALLADFLEC